MSAPFAPETRPFATVIPFSNHSKFKVSYNHQHLTNSSQLALAVLKHSSYLH